MEERKNYNQAFRDWAQRNAIRAADLAQKTGYSYIHAWNLLSGRTDVTKETLGRVVLAYGAEDLRRESLGE